MRFLFIFVLVFSGSSFAYQHPELTVKGKVLRFDAKSVDIQHKSGKVSKLARHYFKKLEPLKQNQSVAVALPLKSQK